MHATWLFITCIWQDPITHSITCKQDLEAIIFRQYFFHVTQAPYAQRTRDIDYYICHRRSPNIKTPYLRSMCFLGICIDSEVNSTRG